MPIITLTTDLGTSDHYAAALKGSLLSACPEAQVIDISHHITPQSAIHGAFVFKHAWHYFPEGSIHLVAVDLASAKDLRLLYFMHKGHHFLIPDNGIISLAFEETPAALLHIPSWDFPLMVAYKEVYALVCRNILDRVAPEGNRVSNLRNFTIHQPLIYPDMIKGAVIYVDHFNNAITNISGQLFEENLKGRNYEIIFGRNRVIHLCRTYSEVPQGEKLCLFNSAHLLEVAINQGKASSLLNLLPGNPILINFRDQNPV